MTTSGMVIDPIKARRDLCLKSYYAFVRSMWHIVNPGTPYVDNWHIRYICNTIQEACERILAKQKKLYDYIVINVSPGSSKSTLTSVFLHPWLIARDPTHVTIGGSYTEALSLDLSRKSRSVTEHEDYRALFPHVKPRKDLWTLGEWGTTEGGVRIACTVGGSITGRHADLITVDDPLDPQGARSVEELLAANLWMRETIPSRVKNQETAPTILTMQRLHQNDPTNLVLSDEHSKVLWLCFPAEIVAGLGVHPPECQKFYVDGLFDARRFPRDVLAKRRSTLGEYGYAGQYLQSPVPLEGGMFQINRITLVDQPPTEFVRVVRYWDKAGTKKGGKYTVGLKLGATRDGKYYVLDVVRGQWDTGERERTILGTAKRDGKRIGKAKMSPAIEQEPGSGGKESAENTAKMLAKAGFQCIIDRPTGATGDKTARADPVSTIVNLGLLYVVNGPYVADLLDELKFFPFSTNMDQVDALSGAFAVLTKKSSAGVI
jgi:predicted phage terminase large subunit-like protein